MPGSHHSHSGQFCLHAEGDLEDMINAAVSRRMDTLVLTEHIPRDQENDLYPEEVSRHWIYDVLDLPLYR